MLPWLKPIFNPNIILGKILPGYIGVKYFLVILGGGGGGGGEVKPFRIETLDICHGSIKHGYLFLSKK